MFPSFVLAKLYVSGSLKNVENGFELKLKDNLESGTITGLGPLKVDDTAYAPEVCRIKIGTVEKRGSEITRQSPLPIRVGVEILMTVEGAALPAGSHKIHFQIYTQEIGLVQFNVTDSIA